MKNTLHSGGFTKIILLFILGFLGNTILEITPETQWVIMSQPYHVLNGLYNGALSVYALLLQSPLKSVKLSEEDQSSDSDKPNDRTS